jgi:uncharacterized protein (TIGR03437 family)
MTPRVLLPLLFVVSQMALLGQVNSPINCSVSSNPTVLRTNSRTDLAGDVAIQCTGGNTPATNANIPAVNITVTFSAPVTSAVYDSTSTPISEALLLLDDPALGNQFPCTQTNCTNVVGRAFGAAANQNKNIFQGRRSNANSFTFLGVPLFGAGGSGTRTFRIVNARVDATGLIVGGGLQAFVSIQNPPANLSLNNATAVVGVGANSHTVAVHNAGDTQTGVAVLPAPGPFNTTVNSTSQPTFLLRFTEAPPTGFRLPFTGAANQTIVGINPGIESGYYNTAFPSTNALSAAGIVSQHNYLSATFTGIPANVRIFVATSIGDAGAQLGRISTSTGGQFVFETPTFVPTQPTVNISNNQQPMAELQVTQGQATALWRINSANQNAVNSFAFPVLVSYSAAAAATINVETRLRGTEVSALDIPRFNAAAINTQPAFRIANTALTLSSGTLPNGTVGVPYGPFQLQASGGTPPYTFIGSVITLPIGISLSPSGVLSGTPAVAGPNIFAILVADSTGAQAPGSFSLTVLPGFTITTETLPLGVAGSSYGPAQLAATGGVAPYTFSATNLPSGLTLSTSGALSGTPVTNSSGPVTFTVRDATNVTRTRSIPLNINPQLAITMPTETVTVTQGRAFQTSLGATGGIPPYNFSAPTLPSGISLTTVGVVSGTFATSGPNTIRFTVTDATRATAQRDVNFRVLADESNCAPTLTTPTIDLFLAQRALRVTRTLGIVNNCSTPLTLSATVDYRRANNWLSLTAPNITVPAGATRFLNVQTAAEVLSPGAYQANILLRGASANFTVPVNLQVSSVNSFRVAPAGLSFVAVQNGPAPAAQSFTLFSEPAGPVGFTSSIQTTSGGNWLSVTPTTGTTSAASPARSTLSATVNPAGLAPGDYFGQIILTSNSPANPTTAALTVALTIVARTTSISPTVDRSGLFLVDRETQEILITNPTTAPVTFFTTRFDNTGTINWFGVAPSSATIGSGAQQRIQISSLVSGLAPGVRQGTLAIRFSDGSLRNIQVAQIITPTSLAPQSGRAVDACTVRSIHNIFTSIAEGARLPVGLPVHVEVVARDNCGNPVNNGITQLNFPVCCGTSRAMEFNGDGRYSLTWSPIGQRNSVLLAATRSLDAELEDFEQANVEVGVPNIPAAPVPVIDDERRVQNGASFETAPLAPGSIVSIRGFDLADRTEARSDPPFDVQFSTTTVSLDGVLLPLSFISPTQINAQLPYNIPPNATPRNLFVRRGTLLSTATPVKISDVGGAVFQIFRPDRVIGAVTDKDSKLITPEFAVPRGEPIVIYGTGLGLLDRPVTAGQPAPFANTTATSRVFLGGVEARVEYSGLTPGGAGLYQVNAIVPMNAPTGNAVELELIVNGVRSPKVTISIR